MTRTGPGISPFTKIAVTVPTEVYEVVERLRLRQGRSRSSVVASALEDWIRSADRAEADRRYAEGYLRTPEAVDEIAAVAAQATSHWTAWAPAAPMRFLDSQAPGSRPAPRGPRPTEPRTGRTRRAAGSSARKRSRR